MLYLPAYINIIFTLTTLLTVLLLYKAAHNSKLIVIVALLWLALQSLISLSGFYTVTNVFPPRFILLLVVPLVFIILIFLTKKGRKVIDRFDTGTLTLLHIVRIPVEITLYWLFLYKAVPKMITFEGRNFDILCGLTAPLIYYLGYIKKILGTKTLMVWNIICLLLLSNVVITAVLSAPLPFQQFAFDQPNIAILYFPFFGSPAA